MKKKMMENEDTGNKTIDILKIVVDEYTMFQKSKDTDEKLNHIMEVVFGTFLYFLIRYDYVHYLKLKMNDTKEDKDNE